jgi:hypothetical protein
MECEDHEGDLLSLKQIAVVLVAVVLATIGTLLNSVLCLFASTAAGASGTFEGYERPLSGAPGPIGVGLSGIEEWPPGIADYGHLAEAELSWQS